MVALNPNQARERAAGEEAVEVEGAEARRREVMAREVTGTLSQAATPTTTTHYNLLLDY